MVSRLNVCKSTVFWDVNTIYSGINLSPCFGRKMEAAGCSEAVCTALHGVTSQKTVRSTVSQENTYNLNIHSYENIRPHTNICNIKLFFCAGCHSGISHKKLLFAEQSLGITALK
jgi:hypothetical protein